MCSEKCVCNVHMRSVEGDLLLNLPLQNVAHHESIEDLLDCYTSSMLQECGSIALALITLFCFSCICLIQFSEQSVHASIYTYITWFMDNDHILCVA